MTIRTKRAQKESAILDAAEQDFKSLGYANAKMENIGKEAGVSKATVYFYFESKENLYMAIAFRAMSMLNDMMYTAVHESRNKSGLESVLSLMETYFEFGSRYPLYTEAMLDYMSYIRSSSSGTDEARLTEALKDSIYFKKARDIHNIPVSLVVQEIKRGLDDKSIKNQNRPEMLYLTAWGSVLGYLKLVNVAGKNRSIHKVSIQHLKDYIVKVLHHGLIHNI